MDTTKRLNQEPLPPSPSRNSNISSDCSSHEFEFWMLRNSSFPKPNLLSANELFVDGVLLPLHLLSPTNKLDQPDPEPPSSETPVHDTEPNSSAVITESSSALSSASKRWRDIFKKTKKNKNNTEEKEKGKKKERRSGSGASSAELNIHIWPFSRSRSDGNSGTRPKLFPGTPANRKVNSAPCYRSNSAEESKSRKWLSSPGRTAVHVGRSISVWQVRRGAAVAKNSEPQALSGEKGSKKRETARSRRSKVSLSGSAKARVLNLNVQRCIGYIHNLSCRSNENGVVAVSGATTTNGGDSGGGNGDDRNWGNLFNLRSLFTKKSIVTSH